MNRKRYYKCVLCLATVCIRREDSDDKSEFNHARKECGICGGPMDFMGYVEGATYGNMETLCKCDQRCTNASGPSCDCQCGGKNHGAGMEGFYEQFKAEGKVVIKARHDIEKHKAMADEWLKAKDAAKARIALMPGYADYKERRFIARVKWWAIKHEEDMIAKARGYKTHKRRMDVINAVGVIVEKQAGVV